MITLCSERYPGTVPAGSAQYPLEIFKIVNLSIVRWAFGEYLANLNTFSRATPHTYSQTSRKVVSKSLACLHLQACLQAASNWWNPLSLMKSLKNRQLTSTTIGWRDGRWTVLGFFDSYSCHSSTLALRRPCDVRQFGMYFLTLTLTSMSLIVRGFNVHILYSWENC